MQRLPQRCATQKQETVSFPPMSQKQRRMLTAARFSLWVSGCAGGEVDLQNIQLIVTDY